MNKGGTMYRLVGFEMQEQELFALAIDNTQRRGLKSLIKTLRDLTHQQFPDREAAHAYYRGALSKVRQALVSRTDGGEAGQAAV